MDPYKVLAIEPGCSRVELKARYKVVSKLYHPDKVKSDATAAFLFQQIVQAYESIKNVAQDKPATTDTRRPLADAIPKSGRNTNDPASTSSSNTVTTVGAPRMNAYFTPDFNLTEYFGDIPIPKEGNRARSTTPRKH